MNDFVDMHSHIIPGVDDGAADAEEMKRMLRMAYEDGIRHIIATPHHHPARGMTDVETLIRRATVLQEAAHAMDPRFRIYLGMEIFFMQDTVEKLKRREILTMNRRNFVLTEFSPGDNYHKIRQGIGQLQMNGYTVILAHVERYPCLMESVERTAELAGMGTRLQVNSGSITGDSGRRVKNYIRELLDRDLVFCVGTDAHNSRERAPVMKKAAGYVQKKYGEEQMRRIFFGNAAQMLRKSEKR